MSESEKSHLEQIEIIIGRKLKPIYWTVAIMLTIFITVAGPLTFAVINLSRENAVQINSDEVYKNFITKPMYHQLQKDEHVTDIEAINNPENAGVIYMRHNNSEADRLEIRLRGNNQ